eukprot:TRINITY_DN9054_c0_g1_i1.p1 TRINITY_DN9054_c0_g1~~TRINITY_DN9054_c0_g1_i1.p1  ORF type:complete len:107 (-),score=17.78 TRINITY_DN9054_c0_g1_i1:96-416(-)
MQLLTWCVLLVLFLQLIQLDAKKLEERSARCSLPGETGKCRARFIKYRFNQETLKCERYVFGGCGAEPPFANLKQCQEACEGGQQQPQQPEPLETDDFKKRNEKTV